MSALRDALRDLSDTVFFDLLESGDAYVLVVDVPGVSADTVDVGVEDGQITIEARREKDVPGEYTYLEENRSLFLDVELPLPSDAAETDVTATVDRGVLELTMAKRGTASETTIEVVDEDSSDEPPGTGSDGDE